MASQTPSSPSSNTSNADSFDGCLHCERPRAELPVMDKSGDERLIRTWRTMAPKLTDEEHERFDELLEASGEESRSLSDEENKQMRRLSFQQQLANTVQSYVLCQGCLSLEDDLFFASPEEIREALSERDW